MKLTKLEVDCLKNLKGVSLEPHPSYNLIFGENAQGKTNLLEAIWALTGCKSFRSTRDRDLLPFEGGTLQVAVQFQDVRRSQSLRLCMISGGTAPEKKFWCNDVPQKGSALFSVFHCVIFTPEDLALVTGSPQRRRSFLDLCSAQLYMPLLPMVRRYQLVLNQRNALLKQRLPEEQTMAMLPAWDEQLTALGTEIAIYRAAYVRRLSEACVPLYAEISGGRETVELHYASNVYGKDAQDMLPEHADETLKAHYRERLLQSRSNDLLFGHTGAGVHRDDLKLKIDGKSARDFGSQGQKKSLALALKLSQALIYREKQRESPIVLLDDVMGELDETRQLVVSTIVRQMQVFVTTCHPESLAASGEGKRFFVRDGTVTEEG